MSQDSKRSGIYGLLRGPSPVLVAGTVAVSVSATVLVLWLFGLAWNGAESPDSVEAMTRIARDVACKGDQPSKEQYPEGIRYWVLSDSPSKQQYLDEERRYPMVLEPIGVEWWEDGGHLKVDDHEKSRTVYVPPDEKTVKCLRERAAWYEWECNDMVAQLLGEPCSSIEPREPRATVDASFISCQGLVHAGREWGKYFEPVYAASLGRFELIWHLSDANGPYLRERGEDIGYVSLDEKGQACLTERSWRYIDETR